MVWQFYSSHMYLSQNDVLEEMANIVWDLTSALFKEREITILVVVVCLKSTMSTSLIEMLTMQPF